MGGQVERLVDVVKRALYKSIGRASLTWNEPEEVLLDVEVALNNRLLSYVEDDVSATSFDFMCHDLRSTKTCPRRRE